MGLPSFINNMSTVMPWEIKDRHLLPTFINKFNAKEKEEIPLLFILEEDDIFNIYDISIDSKFEIILDGYDAIYFITEVEKLYNISLFDNECIKFSECNITFRDIDSICKFIKGHDINFSDNIIKYIKDYSSDSSIISSNHRNYIQLIRDKKLKNIFE